MPGVDLKINVPGLKGMTDALGKKRMIHEAIGMKMLAMVGANFEQSGIWAKWAPLKASTLYGRRGKGGGGKALMDTGRLRASFRSQATTQSVRVGSPLTIAKYHDEGRKGPWVIKPKTAKALAFPFPGGGVIVTKGMTKSYGHQKKGAAYFKGKGFLVVKGVKHPGYPARFLLPPTTFAESYAAGVVEAIIGPHTG